MKFIFLPKKLIIVLFILIAILLISLSILALANNKSDLNGDLKKSLSSALSESNDVYIRDIIHGNFDEFCIFLSDSSMPQDGAKNVQLIIDRNHLAGNFVPQEAPLIFMIIFGHSYRVYSYPTSQIKINNDRFWISYAEEKTGDIYTEGGSCISADRAVAKLAIGDDEKSKRVIISQGH